MLRDERHGRAAAHARPVLGAELEVAQHAVLVHVAWANVPHARVAGCDGSYAQRVAHDRHLDTALLGRAGHHREARGARRQRARARRPHDVADVAPRRAVLDGHGLDLAGAAVHAQRRVGVVDGVAVLVDGREALRALERDGARVLLDVLGLRRAEQLGAIRDEKRVKLLVEVLQRVPDLLVHLEADGQLVLCHDVLESEAVIGHARRVHLDRLVACADELERHAHVRVCVDEA